MTEESGTCGISVNCLYITEYIMYRSHYYGCSSGYTICRTSSLTALWETFMQKWIETNSKISSNLAMID